MTPYGSLPIPPSGLNQHLRERMKQALRAFGAATASQRCNADYLIIGAKRGGSTSMARWLVEHPDVGTLFPSAENRKGTYFFDVNFGKGVGWYRSHFPTRAAQRIRGKLNGSLPLLGDATPYYLHHPHAADRAFRQEPNAKVIALLRNPIDRAYGHWAERTREGVETLDFGSAIRAEGERLEGEEQRILDDPSYVSFPHQHFSYIDQGRYHRGLKRWLVAYPSNQISVIRSEDLFANPAKIYRQTLLFLGLGEYEPAQFAAWNVKKKDPVEPADRRFLIDALADDVAQLETLLGRSMDWEGFNE